MLRGIPHEYVAYNVSPDQSYARLIEAVTLIKKAWTLTEPFGWEGEFYQFRAVSIWPRPLQQPHPPILISASTAESARVAARHVRRDGIDLRGGLRRAQHRLRDAGTVDALPVEPELGHFPLPATRNADPLR